MSLLKAIKAQLGLSNTPANNFTITAEADNGTLKLARGNAGATTQDILSVDASGKVSAPVGLLGFTFVLGNNGYIQFPSWCFGGVMIQWGGVTTESGVALKAFATSFPTVCLKVIVSPDDTSTPFTCAATVNSNVTFSCVVRNSAGTPVATGLNYIAIGK